MNALRQFCLSLTILIVAMYIWNVSEGNTMKTQTGGCAKDDRDKIAEMLHTVFSVKQEPDVISCGGGSTAWASFSHISAEITPASISEISGFESLNDPAWFPMDLFEDEYQRAFDGVDWSKVTSHASFDPVTRARVFLINSTDGRSFVLITSE